MFHNSDPAREGFPRDASSNASDFDNSNEMIRSGTLPPSLLDLLRPRVRSGVEGAVGCVLGGATGGFDDVVHSFQRCDISRFEAGDVSAVPLVGVGARVCRIHVRGFLQVSRRPAAYFSSRIGARCASRR